MIPIRDVNPTRITPVLTVLLIAANLGVFFLIQGADAGPQQQEFLYRRAVIACEVTTGVPLSLQEIRTGDCVSGGRSSVFVDKNVYLAIVTSMFLHGSILHVAFNMWFLWIFGNNVEEAYGRIGYLSLYLVGGVAATGAFIILNAGSTVPLVGASGAIAAVLGAYAVLFPLHRVLALVGWFLLPVPAAVLLAIWFLGQFGLGGTGVAWEAHVGGFVVGALVSLTLRARLLARVRALHGPFGYR